MRFIFTATLLFFVTLGVSAQSKTAYINFQQLIGLMPETKLANDTLRLYQDELAKDGQYLVDEYTRLVKQYDSTGANTHASQEKLAGMEKEIRDAQTRITDYRERMEEKIAQKDQLLLKPIMEKAKKALKEVATGKGYTMVIDNSKDAVLIASETDDLLEAVKARLGLK
ncbi:OmpH family outer membrane protein [Chitinophaga solisilvae]|uniref:OmpH family outer membrane protein n=1 Tax=Chitinophaga solisilvae TaxID=1233460 RepID=A0A433WCV3_9BACT|nr:OmpH family outer membrane protein [Chitinophaga solisilvae]NSL90643.1 OmpH family outer membrane protein [Chitinophaga solisilvae]